SSRSSPQVCEKRDSSTASTAVTVSLSRRLSSSTRSSGSSYWPSVRSGRSRLAALELAGRPARARPELGLHLGQLGVDLRVAGQLLELAVDVVLPRPERGEVLERPRGL